MDDPRDPRDQHRFDTRWHQQTFLTLMALNFEIPAAQGLWGAIAGSASNTRSDWAQATDMIQVRTQGPFHLPGSYPSILLSRRASTPIAMLQENQLVYLAAAWKGLRHKHDALLANLLPCFFLAAAADALLAVHAWQVVGRLGLGVLSSMLGQFLSK